MKNGAFSVRVCKVAFLRIHGMSNGRLSRALKAEEAAGGSPHADQRGRHPPGNKTSEELIAGVTHIMSFPHYKSHYSCKDNPNKQFLSPYLNVQLMHRLYKEECAKNNTPAVSEWPSV